MVLDESGPVRVNQFDWKEEKRYRVLQLGPMDTDEVAGGAVYSQHLFINNTNYDEGQMIAPYYKGNTLDEIPFQFVNTTDITPAPEAPPLLGLANICLSMYRSDADYRQSLHMQGQDTLVVVGGSGENGDKAPQRIGPGALINKPAMNRLQTDRSLKVACSNNLNKVLTVKHALGKFKIRLNHNFSGSAPIHLAQTFSKSSAR